MRIAFVDFIPWDYTVETVYLKPFGGSQSALCYLAEELARRGHEVWLVNNCALPGAARGVMHLPIAKAQPDIWKAFDAVVLLNSVKPGLSIRPLLRYGARLIAWLQHAHDQPAVKPLARAEVRATFDGFALLSDWQRDQFVQSFSLDPARLRVLRNAISPVFADLFEPGEDIVAAKATPPVLAYTSTPFRGLDLLVHSFPAVRKEVKGARLRVYSSMAVYQSSDDSDAAEFGNLYDLCRETPGVEYIGSLPQSALAPQLRDVCVWAYPNHFAETGCIAAMEAMAAGAMIVTSDLGALAETTAGFARLLPVNDDWLGYSERFVGEVVKSLERLAESPAEMNDALARQVAYVNAECTWQRRADKWEQWLEEA